MPISVRITKRLMDLLISITVLLFLSPILLLIALAIKSESPGPVLYIQRRVKYGGGRNPEQFNIFKFRTMAQNAESETGAVNAVTGDPRVTKLGKILRSTRLDEIPNLFNVLIGDMSVIGPRADRVEIFNEVENDFPFVWERTKYVKPGITGLAQLELKSDGSLTQKTKLNKILPSEELTQPVQSFRFKLYYDFTYALRLTNFWSFLITDCMIIIRTPIIMFFKRNVI